MTLHDLIDAIRAAVEPDAPATARAAGIDACRTILAALGAMPGEPMAASASSSPSPIAAIVGGLRNMPPDELLDLAITKLRALVPPDSAPASTGFKYLRVPVHKVSAP